MPTIDEHAQATLVKARAPQIRPRLQDAVRLIVTEGLSQADAAKRAGMTPHSLYAALRKPHVRAFMIHVRDTWLESRTSKAWLNIAELADAACSEDVRLKANRTFLEAAGELGFKGKEADGTARQLVQILISGGAAVVQPTTNRLPNVVEAEPYQILTHQPSDSHGVRRAEVEADDDE